ncbi:MAG: bifunctional oligoribonuclease/PAP phosphatase NrnA [Bacilli bacterium]
MVYKKIYKKIKQYDNIVIARHVGADPDALASSIGLKELILNTFPNKNVFVVGKQTARFKYLGVLDKAPDDLTNCLLIITDTPDKKRVDGINPDNFNYTIKIDHHPFIESFCNIEWMDATACSASQMIIELALKTKLKINKEIAEKLFVGVVADTNRFLYSYTTAKTFSLISKLIDKTGLDFTNLYEQMYIKSYNDIKFSGYIALNLNITDDGLGYIKLDDQILKEYNVDASTPGNLIENFGYIDEIKVLIFLTEDTANNFIKCQIRSRGPVINDTATHFNGGGHAMASGAKTVDFEQGDELIEELNEKCREYNIGK